MRIPASEQRQLLDLQQIDQHLAKSAHESDNLAIEADVRTLAKRRKKLHLDAVRLKTEGDDFGRQAKRVDEDIDRVRARQKRNREMADSGVDARVQRELQHESDSLVRRQRELEDAEISFLERQEEAAARAKSLSEDEAVTATELAAVGERARQERQDLDGRVAGLRAERREVVAGLSSTLVSLYEDTRSRRGVGVAVLAGGQCSACRIEMAPEELLRLRETDEDQVETCEECGCLLLRD